MSFCVDFLQFYVIISLAQPNNLIKSGGGTGPVKPDNLRKQGANSGG